jgi:hypothetical protein
VIAALEYVACPVTWADLDQATGVSAAKELTRITEDRHDIVHRGKKPYVRRDLAEKANNLISGIAGYIDVEVRKLY